MRTIEADYAQRAGVRRKVASSPVNPQTLRFGNVVGKTSEALGLAGPMYQLPILDDLLVNYRRSLRP